MPADEMAAHFQNHCRHSEREADPEPARHVREFGIGRIVEARDLRLQRHAADRAASGPDLADLRMHRAGIDRAFGHGGLRPALFLQIADGIGRKLGAATGRAEMEGLAAIVEAVLAGRRVDLHAADRVEHADGIVGLVAAGGMDVA